jgi:cytochrome c oxidase subunit 2
VLAGEYPVLCAELCGSGHGDMRATIIVHEDEAAYMDWFDEQVFIIDNPPDDPAELGLQLLSAGAYPCNSCHTLDALGWTGITGPNLNGIGDRAVGRVPGLPAEEYLSRSLYFPSEFLVPGFGALMLEFQHDDLNGPNYMSLEDHKGIVAYLCTQTSTGESACDLDNLDQIISSYE